MSGRRVFSAFVDTILRYKGSGCSYGWAVHGILLRVLENDGLVTMEPPDTRDPRWTVQ